MRKGRSVANTFCAFLLLATFFAKPNTGPPKGRHAGTWLRLGTSASFYSVNLKHAQNPAQKINFLLSLEHEWRLDRQQQSFILAGVDYLMHGLSFNSYFFKQDSVALYNKTFSYNYSVYIHELDIPIEYKFVFRRRESRMLSPYVKAGYYLRWLLTSDVKVTHNGAKVKYDSPEMKFRTPLFNQHLNTFAGVSFGFQQNSVASEKGHLSLELNFRYGFSQYYFERPYAPSSLYINGSHIFLLLGYKF